MGDLMTAVLPFDQGTIQGIARPLGEAFTGSEIAGLFQAARVPDPGEVTKWRRITAALVTEQERSRSGNCTVAFVKAAMKPVRWTANRAGFDDTRDALNGVLAFSGLEIRKDGLVYRRAIARTHDQALARSQRLRDEMQRRGGHADVFRYCTREFVADDCFGAVFEATKGLAERIRQLTSLDQDGSRLVQDAFEGPSPMIAFNALRTETERNEQRGLANIMKGVFSAFRNPAAHEPKLIWQVNEADALDLLCTLSLIHRRLDISVVLRHA